MKKGFRWMMFYLFSENTHSGYSCRIAQNALKGYNHVFSSPRHFSKGCTRLDFILFLLRPPNCAESRWEGLDFGDWSATLLKIKPTNGYEVCGWARGIKWSLRLGKGWVFVTRENFKMAKRVKGKVNWNQRSETVENFWKATKTTLFQF